MLYLITGASTVTLRSNLGTTWQQCRQLRCLCPCITMIIETHLQYNWRVLASITVVTGHEALCVLRTLCHWRYCWVLLHCSLASWRKLGQSVGCLKPHAWFVLYTQTAHKPVHGHGHGHGQEYATATWILARTATANWNWSARVVAVVLGELPVCHGRVTCYNVCRSSLYGDSVPLK